MKRALIVLAVLCALGVAGVALVLLTFDADRYRPQLVSYLQEILGTPVKLGHLSMGWHGGIAVQLHDLAIEAPGAASSEPLVRVESASAVVRLRPLLRKQVQVASVVLRRPRIHVMRDAQGRLNLIPPPAASRPEAGSAPSAGFFRPAAGGGTASPSAASSQSASVEGSAVSFEVASFRIEDGELHWTDATASPPTDVRLSKVDLVVRDIAPGRPMTVELKGALGAEAENVRLSGRLTLPSETQTGSVEQVTATITDFSLEQVLAPARADEPRLEGKLTGTLEGRVPTLDPQQLSRALSGRGRLALAQPKIANLNVLREVFGRLSILPGLVEALEARLPDLYREKLEATDTLLAPLDVAFQLQDGSLRFDALELGTDAFELTGSGRVGLDRSVQIRSTLRIEPALSAALIKGVHELQGLANAQGWMEIPVTIQGRAPQLAVLPDVDYVASKLIVTTVGNLLEGFLQKALEKTPHPQEEP
ncbi:MAG: AsmA family protein [Candidatus Omnitrophota bacterium]|nr:AsmA family protein [Candidatus Omnitrophota bacterium]